jgi:hypothetical protein
MLRSLINSSSKVLRPIHLSRYFAGTVAYQPDPLDSPLPSALAATTINSLDDEHTQETRRRLLKVISELTTPLALLHAYRDNQAAIRRDCSKFFTNHLLKATQASLKSRLVYKGPELESGLLLEFKQYFSQLDDPAHLRTVERSTLLLTVRLIRYLLANTESPNLTSSFRNTRIEIFKELGRSVDDVQTCDAGKE